MQVETALPAPPARWRLSRAGAARLTLPLVLLLTLVPELALADRKYGLFSGGFGQSQAVDTPFELAAFAAAVLACQAFLFWLLYRLVRALHRRRAGHLAVPLQLCLLRRRRRGRGHGRQISGARLLQRRDELPDRPQSRRRQPGRRFALQPQRGRADRDRPRSARSSAIVVALLLLRRRWRGAAPLPDVWRLGWRKGLAAFLAAAAFILFGVNRVDDAREAAARFDSVHRALDLRSTRRPISTATAGAGSPTRSTASRSTPTPPSLRARHTRRRHRPGRLRRRLHLHRQRRDRRRRRRSPAQRRNVILIVLESTRADAIGRAVDGRPVTPTLERAWPRAAARRRALIPMSASPPRRCRACSPASSPRSTTASRCSATSSPTATRSASFRARPRISAAPPTWSACAAGRSSSTATRLRNERSFSFAAEGSVNVDGRILLREFDRRLGRPEAWARPHFLYFNLQSAHFPYSEPMMDRVLPGAADPARRDRCRQSRLDRAHLLERGRL